MSAKIFILPLTNPLKPIWQTDLLSSNNSATTLTAFDPSFNFRTTDQDFFYRTLKYYEDKNGYCQPYQQSDTIRIQWLSEYSTLAQYQYARLLDQYGNVYTLKTVTVVKESGTYTSEIDGVLLSSLTLYTVTIKLYDVAEGKYFLQLDHYDGITHKYVIHEPIDVKQIHENTVRIDYYNSYNDQSTIYPNLAYIPQLRVHGCFTEMDNQSKFSVYEDQPLDMEMVSGIAYRLYTLTLGQMATMGIPEWYSDKLERALLCDNLYIDGIQYTRDEGAKLEAKKERRATT